MAIVFRGSKVKSVFRLNGADENSATYALGWVLEHSQKFRDLVIEAALGEALPSPNAVITMQKFGPDKGYTDLEIEDGQNFHVIFEAKRWWELPSSDQINRYLPRLKVSSAKKRCFATLSAADVAQAKRQLPSEFVGERLPHLSWRDMLRMAR